MHSHLLSMHFNLWLSHFTAMQREMYLKIKLLFYIVGRLS